MIKVIGIVTKQRAAVAYTFYSVDVDKECVTNIVKNNFQERKSKELQTGIVRILFAQTGFIKHKKNVVWLRLAYLFLFLFWSQPPVFLDKKKRVVD